MRKTKNQEDHCKSRLCPDSCATQKLKYRELLGKKCLKLVSINYSKFQLRGSKTLQISC